MIGWHHRGDGHEFEQSLGVGDGQGSLVSSKEQVSFNVVAAVIVHNDFGDKKMKSDIVSIFSPSICLEVMGPDAVILVF